MSATATVEVLTAEVRVLMVGSRQVTLSVYAQLDHVSFDEMEPFGRVRPRDAYLDYAYLIGRRVGDGSLVRSRVVGGPSSISEQANESRWRVTIDSNSRAAEEAERLANQYQRHEDQFHAELHHGYVKCIVGDIAARRADAESGIAHAERARMKLAAAVEPLLALSKHVVALPLIVLAGLR